MNNIQVELFEEDILWFEQYSEENLDTETDFYMNKDDEPDDVAPMMRIGNLFDYATLPDNKWEFYCDISVKLPHMAAVLVRSQYSIYAEDFEWDHLFVVENLRVIISNAIMNGLVQFRQMCIKSEVDLSPEMKEKDPEVTDEMIEGVCGHIIDEYWTNRKPYDTTNAGALTEVELNCPSASSANLTLNLTFLVMEQILFNNRRFNRLHNREVFFEVVPEMKFYSLRMKCIQIGKHDVALTVEDVHYFLICMDCALQMVLGDKGDRLIPVLEEHGVTDAAQQMWFKSASELLNICRASVEESIQHKEKFDWSNLIL